MPKAPKLSFFICVCQVCVRTAVYDYDKLVMSCKCLDIIIKDYKENVRFN